MPFSVIAFVPFPNNILSLVKLVAPVPPLGTDNVSSVALLTFKFVKRDALPAILGSKNIICIIPC